MKMSEDEWMKIEGARIRASTATQPADLDCENCLGSDLNGAYERAHKPKGM